MPGRSKQTGLWIGGRSTGLAASWESLGKGGRWREMLFGCGMEKESEVTMEVLNAKRVLMI